MSFSLAAHVSGTGGTSDTVTTSPAVNTSGATLLVVYASRYNAGATPALDDTYHNTWTPLAEHNASGVSGHTFTYGASNSYPAVQVMAFSGSVAAPAFDQQNGATGAGSDATIQPGNVTPSEDNELVVQGMSFSSGTGEVTINSGFTQPDTSAQGAAMAAAAAYKIQTTAAAVNPTWTTTPTSTYGLSAAAATFKAASGPPPATARSLFRRANLTLGGGGSFFSNPVT